MRCPTLSELPPPPPGKTGWPWTEESPQLPDTMPDGRPWPRVSIVTPSYNQGQFIEETIRSVLLQGYPDLEYIIIDGGSTDGSVDIIRKYEPWLAYWVSEPDKGQADAINKGWRIAKGEIVGWLNSDDMYAPGAAWIAIDFLEKHRDVVLIYGDCNIIDEQGQLILTKRSREFNLAKEICSPSLIPQPTAFFRRIVFEQVGLLDADLHYAMDYDFWTRISLKFQICHIPRVIANFRKHIGSKSVSQMEKFWPEVLMILERTFASPNTSASLKRLKDRAYSNVYLAMGKEHYSNGHMAKARRALIQSIRYDPSQLVRSNALVFLLTSLLGAQFGRALIALRKWQLSATNNWG